MSKNPQKIHLAMVFASALFMLTTNSVYAAITNFVIQGTYGETLINAAGTGNIISAGDTFTILGSYDDTLQPVVETKANGMVTLVDAAWFGFFVDYSSILSLSSDIPLTAINTDYPSAESGLITGFNDGDTKNGNYFTESNTFGVPAQILDIYSNFTHVFLRNTPSGPTGVLEFNFHEEVTPQGPLDLYEWKHDEIALNITSFQTTSVVPVPPAIFLFGSGLIGLLAAKIRRVKRA